MILIEFPKDLCQENIPIKYRNIDDHDWSYLECDIQTLSLLLSNFGIVSTTLYRYGPQCLDNPTTGLTISATYCGAEISLVLARSGPLRIYDEGLRALIISVSGR